MPRSIPIFTENMGESVTTRDTTQCYEKLTIRTRASGYTARTRRQGRVQILPFITEKFHKYSLGCIHLSLSLATLPPGRRCLCVIALCTFPGIN
jgi:hypothetical protein